MGIHNSTHIVILNDKPIDIDIGEARVTLGFESEASDWRLAISFSTEEDMINFTDRLSSLVEERATLKEVGRGGKDENQNPESRTTSVRSQAEEE